MHAIQWYILTSYSGTKIHLSTCIFCRHVSFLQLLIAVTSIGSIPCNSNGYSVLNLSFEWKCISLLNTNCVPIFTNFEIQVAKICQTLSLNCSKKHRSSHLEQISLLHFFFCWVYVQHFQKVVEYCIFRNHSSITTSCWPLNFLFWFSLYITHTW